MPPCLCVSKKSIRPRAIHCADFGNTETQSTRSLCPKSQSLSSLCRSDYVGARYLPRWCHGQRRYAQQQALRAAIHNPILARGVGISKVCKVWRESEKLRGLPWVNATMSNDCRSLQVLRYCPDHSSKLEGAWQDPRVSPSAEQLQAIPPRTHQRLTPGTEVRST